MIEFRCYVKLVEWKEGGYSPFNKPYPQGEIWCGGNMVTHGYYEMPEKTAEDFHTDEQGIRWFKTGDIGQFDEDGSLRIIGKFHRSHTLWIVQNPGSFLKRMVFQKFIQIERKIW